MRRKAQTGNKVFALNWSGWNDLVNEEVCTILGVFVLVGTFAQKSQYQQKPTWKEMKLEILSFNQCNNQKHNCNLIDSFLVATAIATIYTLSTSTSAIKFGTPQLGSEKMSNDVGKDFRLPHFTEMISCTLFALKVRDHVLAVMFHDKSAYLIRNPCTYTWLLVFDVVSALCLRASVSKSGTRSKCRFPLIMQL